MSPNNNEVHIYAKKAGKWEREHVLKEVSDGGTVTTEPSVMTYFKTLHTLLSLSLAWPACHWYGLGP